MDGKQLPVDNEGVPITFERLYADAIRAGHLDIAAEIAVAMYHASLRVGAHD